MAVFSLSSSWVVTRLATKTVMLRALAVAAMAWSLAMPAMAQDMRVAIVNVDRVLRDSTPAKAAQQKIESEFSRREKELQDLGAKVKSLADKLDRDGSVMSESDRVKRQRELAEQDKEFQRKQREFREDLNQRLNEERSNILEKASKAIKQIGEAEKYDLIVQDAIFASPRVDITEKVLKALK